MSVKTRLIALKISIELTHAMPSGNFNIEINIRIMKTEGRNAFVRVLYARDGRSGLHV